MSQDTTPQDRVALGDMIDPTTPFRKWLHLRRCTTCGHIGCCDTSPSQHGRVHYRETGHAIMTSVEPNERWFWDYREARVFEGPELAPPRWRPRDQPVPGPEGRVPPDWNEKLNR